MENTGKKTFVMTFGKFLKQMKPLIYLGCFISLFMSCALFLNLDSKYYTEIFLLYRIVIKTVFVLTLLYCIGLVIQVFCQSFQKEK